MASSSSWDSVEDAKPSLLFFNNDLPSDNINHLYRVLHRRSAELSRPQLAYFIRLCNQAIKEEIAKLPKQWQEKVPDFVDVLSLVNDDVFRKGPLGGAMEGVFLNILQIGMILGHHEVEQVPYQFDQNTTLFGLGVGLLSAAAASVSLNVADLAIAGAHIVRASFRLGIHVYNISEQLEAPNGDGHPWAFVIPGLTAEVVQAELDRYNRDTANPTLSHIFISASDKTSVSVSGPPSRLRQCLKSSDVLRYSNFLALPVHHGLCHAPHIYSAVDVQTIIEDVLDDDHTRIAGRKTSSPLLSSGTGRPYTAKDFRSLIDQVLTELLMNKIHIDNVVDGIVETLDLPSATQQQQNLFAFRNSVILRTMMKNVENKCDGRITFTHRDLIEWTKRDERESETPMSPKRSKLAVVGMSCRLPGGANDLELFWKLIVDKRDVHTTIPPDRFDLSTHFDPTGQIENTTQTPYMNHIDSPGLFDAGFFNISPKEAEQMDPMHRLALVTAYEALEMSGYSPNRTRSTSSPRVGTYYGQASDDWRELNASQNIGTYAVPSGERGFANGRINYFFKFSGPSFNMDTACCGLAAVNAACSALWAGDVDTAIAGGLNVITDPDNFCQLGKGHFLSLTGQCKVWDEAADGYCRADGVGSVVIKRLDDALADNDKILATILAANTNHSADAISITHPHAPTQAQNYQRVMSQAGFSPLDVSYVELHGTGTQAGDREEAKSVSDVFAPVAPRRKKKDRLRLGAVKSNIGHGEAAAGIASFIKVLLMYQKSAIPPQIGVKKLNPTLPPDLEERNIGLNWEYVEWPRPKTGSRLAIVNSFGAHGGNTTVLLSDGPVPSPVIADPRLCFPLIISARSKNSLKMNAEALLQYINDHEDAQLGDLSYTLTARRMHHPFRLATSVKDISQAKKFLSVEIEKMEQQQWVSTVPLKAPTVAFTFTGQGAFYVGMCSQLYSHCSSFREDVQRLDRLSQSFNLGFESVIPIIDGSAGSSDAVDPVASQLAIVLIELALAHYWATLGIKPSMVMGHSLGEFAALAVAGVISELDALYLTTARAKLMAEHCQVGTHTMLAVRCSIDRLEELLAGREQDYELACINGESDLVISGAKPQIQDLASILATAGLKSTALNVPFAFHSAQMDPILESFAQLAENVTFKAPQIPVISPLLAECIFDGKTLNHEYLCRATREQVDVVGALDAAQELGIADADTVWIDIGPHMIAGGMVRNILKPTIVVPSVRRDEDNFSTLVSSLVILHRAGVSPVWNEYFREYEQAHQVLHLPTYRWNDKNYWIPYLGTWTLDKAHIKENLDEARQNKALSGISGMGSKLKTSTIHGIVSEAVDESTVTLVTLSDLLDPAFLEAVEGHRMNNHGVASSSIWADMAFTVGRYLHGLGYPRENDFHMNLHDMEILHAQVARSRKDGPQLIQLEATLDIHARSVTIFLYNVSQDGIRDAEYYGSCKIQFEDAATWSKNWKRLEHLVGQRIQALDQLATEGLASKINRNMAYTLFKNVVTYANHYRGMRSVVLKDYEAFADVTLHPDELGVWHTPPHWIDSLCHLGGFILNGSDASNTEDFFYVTPGWETFRLARPPQPGASYRSYVQMVPSEEDPKFWTGDVYILQGDTIIGMMGQMKFRQINRILMDRFFSPSEIHGTAHASSTSSKVKTIAPAAAEPVAQRTTATIVQPTIVQPTIVQPTIVQPAPVSATAEKVEPADEENSLIAGAIDLILKETGVDASELKDDTTFMQIGVDSLMSLVLVEKFKNILKVEIKSSLFIECETVGVFKEWLGENR
ncbi:putative PKS-like protein biosynthetic cluster [Curvularia kusanoi]|uniref:PKS-like protein biosynthetic cluster n=1 Tax=Curvularia kusanoi TaxID=90978 RepID=A0A9P4T366_CURKU|nr:putative PKS-like protein biosynthetic cluster [Curvularia kusanoi]